MTESRRGGSLSQLRHNCKHTMSETVQNLLINREQKCVVVLHFLWKTENKILSQNFIIQILVGCPLHDDKNVIFIRFPATNWQNCLGHPLHIDASCIYLCWFHKHGSDDVGAVGAVPHSKAADDGPKMELFVGTEGAELQLIVAPTLDDGRVADLHLGWEVGRGRGRDGEVGGEERVRGGAEWEGGSGGGEG